jgi:hypothetical protein
LDQTVIFLPSIFSNSLPRLPATTEQEREWRRILGNKMVRAEEENIPAGNEPQAHYNLQITPENYEKFLRGEELSESVSVELQMPVEDKRMYYHFL